MSDVNLQGSFGGQGGSSLSFRNILINGEVTRVNQRGFDGNWAGLSTGAYGYDRWKKADASNISQIVEEGNFIPDAEYVLSGTNVTTQVVTAPSSGNWTITVPNTASYVQLERGSVASPFEHRPYGLELSLCKRYCHVIKAFDPTMDYASIAIGTTNTGGTQTLFQLYLPVPLRALPSISQTGDFRVWYSNTSASAGTLSVGESGSPTSVLLLSSFSPAVGSVVRLSMYTTNGTSITLDAEL